MFWFGEVHTCSTSLFWGIAFGTRFWYYPDRKLLSCLLLKSKKQLEYFKCVI